MSLFWLPLYPLQQPLRRLPVRRRPAGLQLRLREQLPGEGLLQQALPQPIRPLEVGVDVLLQLIADGEAGLDFLDDLVLFGVGSASAYPLDCSSTAVMRCPSSSRFASMTPTGTPSTKRA